MTPQFTVTGKLVRILSLPTQARHQSLDLEARSHGVRRAERNDGPDRLHCEPWDGIIQREGSRNTATARAQ